MAEYKTIQGFKTQSYATDPVPATAAWSSGGNYPASLREGGSAGTQTAGLGFGGNPPAQNLSATYDGTSWTVVNSLGTARYGMAGTGTQTAALCVSGYAGGNTAVTEEYDGTSWTEVNNITTAVNSAAAAGTQTAAVVTAGTWDPGASYATTNYEYDGTSWSVGGAIPTARGQATGFGTQTAAMVTAGISAAPNNPVSTNGMNTVIDYDGTSWTVGTGTINNLRTVGGGSGPATLSLLYGGQGGGATRISNTESYNGTAWTELADLSTGRYGEGSPAGTQTTALFFMGGDTTPGEASNATEEWNDYTSTNPAPSVTMLNEGQIWYNTAGYALKYTSIATGAWASGTAMNTARDQVGSAGADNTNALCFGGTPGSGQVDITEKYNGTTWTEVADLNQARRLIPGIGTTNTAALAAGGYDDPGYQLVNESWNGTSWTEVANLNSAKGAGGAAGTSTAGLAFAGVPGGPMATCEKWDGTSWTEVNDLNDGRRHLASAGTTNTAALAFGGDSPGVTANTETWDGTSWTEVNNLNTAREQLAGAGTSTAALAFGGDDDSSRVAITEKYDGTSWTEVADLATARDELGGAGTTNTSAVAFAGDTPGVTTATEEWDEETLTVKTVTVS